ncbi:MAG: CheR family methyltransferase, partial [Pirellulaceae bacterium]|nr:CheR family methyltransferase [Pirellulaceae bacterium]
GGHADDVASLSYPQKNARVWVPACSTGEEAYSIAILLLEQVAAEALPSAIQVFATDIDERSLSKARTGIYTENNLKGISKERMQRFFSKVDNQHWQVNGQLREVITFARQNLISDAPFSKLDLICCRNLLIYLEPEMQARLLRLFHFSLRSGGYLFLGPSESAGREEKLFEVISKKWRIFRRLDTARARVEVPITSIEQQRRMSVLQLDRPSSAPVAYKDLMQRLVLDECSPAAVLINHKYEIVAALGPLENYLQFPTGELTKDLLAMARLGLRTRIRAAVNQAHQETKAVVDRDAKVKRNGTFYACSISVKPLADPKEAAGMLLVTFQDLDPTVRSPTPVDGMPANEDLVQIIQHLEQELRSTREDLQSSEQEYESSAAELKASNEEVMSMNEELQSANEELETSKEELQSLNEELTTLNNQLQEKLEELDRSNSDLTNLMNISDLATLFLDTELRIKRFTPPLARLLS